MGNCDASPPSGTAPPAATVVIVVCIAALVVIVVIGVYRIHATHQEGSREDEDEVKDPEEDWDNSALTITVNPMEVIYNMLSFTPDLSYTLEFVEKGDFRLDHTLLCRT